MGDTGRDEHGCPGGRLDLLVGKSEGERPFQDVPRFVIGVVDMQVVWSASTPLMDIEGLPGCRDAFSLAGGRLYAANDNGFGHSLCSPKECPGPATSRRNAPAR